MACAKTSGQLARFASHSLLCGPLTAASPVQRVKPDAPVSDARPNGLFSDFHVPARTGRKDAQVLAELLDQAAAWMLSH